VRIEFDYTVGTHKDFENAVISVRKATEAKGWTVLHVHDVREILAVKGFQQEPLKIIEICSGKYANQFLNADRLISLCMPCRISVYIKDGKTFISGMRPLLLSQFFPNLGLEEFTDEVDQKVREIVDEAK